MGALWNNRGLAKVLICLVFAISAYSQLREHKLVQQQIWKKIESFGWRSDGMPPLLLVASVAMQSFGVGCVLLGWDRIGAMLLLIFLIPTTLLMHNPVQPDPASGLPTLDPERLTHCLKNIAIMGGLMLLSRGELSAGDVQAPGPRDCAGKARQSRAAAAAPGAYGFAGLSTMNRSKEKPL